LEVFKIVERQVKNQSSAIIFIEERSSLKILRFGKETAPINSPAKK
jgi:hypothetical protein